MSKEAKKSRGKLRALDLKIGMFVIDPFLEQNQGELVQKESIGRGFFALHLANGSFFSVFKTAYVEVIGPETDAPF